MQKIYTLYYSIQGIVKNITIINKHFFEVMNYKEIKNKVKSDPIIFSSAVSHSMWNEPHSKSLLFSGGLIVVLKPFDGFIDGLLRGGKFEVWKILPKLGVGGCLFELAICLVREILDLTLRTRRKINVKRVN